MYTSIVSTTEKPELEEGYFISLGLSLFLRKRYESINLIQLV